MPAFLSEEWFGAAEEVQDNLGDDLPNPDTTSKINFVVTDAPHSDDDVEAHLDTSDGMRFGAGHMDDGAVTITLPYDVAEKIIIQGDSSAGMQAFMGGQMKIAGDMMQAMQLQTAMGGADASAYRDALAEITD